MAYKGGVQLLPETRRQAAGRTVRGNKLVYWGIAIGILVLVGNLVLSAYAKNLEERLAAVNGELRTQEASRDEEKEDVLVEVQQQSRLMSKLLRNHVYWTEAFGLIERLMQSNVRLESLSASSADGSIEFSAVGANYAAVARQLASFVSGDGVVDVELGGAGVSSDGAIEFNGTLRINTDEILKRQTQ